MEKIIKEIKIEELLDVPKEARKNVHVFYFFYYKILSFISLFCFQFTHDKNLKYKYHQ